MSQQVVEAAEVPRSFLRVGGEEAESFLQGQLSQDITAAPTASFLLDPGGKVVALLRVTRDQDGTFILDTDLDAGEAVLARLRRFLLRVAVELTPIDGWQCVRLHGAPRLPQAIAAVWPAPPHPQEIVGPAARADAEALGVRWLDREEAERRRIAAGVPVSGVDIGPETIPGEVGAWAIDAAVSFTKGCYTGQELVARIDSRGGNVPRPLRVLRARDDVRLRAPAEIALDGKVVGRVTSAAADVALGAVARSVAPRSEVEIRWAGGAARAEVVAADRG
jgi:folate-binding protein YgfZ